MRRLTAAALVTFMSVLLMPPMDAEGRERRGGGPVRYYDQYGQDRGYEWCFRRGRGNSSDCNYYTWDQCQATALGLIGYCERNPWAVNPRG